MYPEFLKLAKHENNTAAATSFRFALAVEKTHHQLYAEAFRAVEAGKDLPRPDIYVCPVCGNPPDQCPICQARCDLHFKVE